MRWDYLLIEVYCFDPACDKSYEEHLEHRQGAWCMADDAIGGYLHSLGFWRMLGEYFSVLWEEICLWVRYQLWDRWFPDKGKFKRWLDEHTLQEGECPAIDEWFNPENWRCKFPEREGGNGKEGA